MMSDAPLVIGVDVGGSNVRAALFSGLSRRGEVVSRPTPDDPGSLLEAICAVVRAVAKAAGVPLERVRAVGVGFPGIFDPGRGVSIYAGNLSRWRGGPVAQPLEERLGVPVSVDNDVRAGGYGELYAGAGAGAESVVYVSIGTGVGGAIFIGKEPYLGAGFAAGELGHMVLDASAKAYRCRCGQVGDVEGLLSGYAIEAAARQATGLTYRATEALGAGQSGVPGLEDVYQHVVRYLSLFFASITAAFNPELIVVGGGLGTHPAYPVEQACEVIREVAPAWIANAARVRRAELGPWSGLTGAAVLALRRFGYSVTQSLMTGGST